MTDTLTVDEASAEHASDRTITFVRPIIGFSGSRRFALRSLDESYRPFSLMSSLDEDGLGFIVVSPGLLFTDYVIEIPDVDVASLQLESSDDVEVFTIVTTRAGQTPTVNLMGPIIVNRRVGIAGQIVLQDGAYSVAVPVDAPSARG